MVKKLIIAPHIDDEVLGCGGILDDNTYVYFCGIDESKLPPDPDHRIPVSEQEKEIKAVAEFFGFKYEIDYENKVNHFNITDFIGKIEDTINKLQPDKIYIPHSGFNQDHQTIFNACQVALRPHDKNFFVKKVIIYEAIHDFLWSHKKFNPNHFIRIDIERKNKGYSLHNSQVRAMRSQEMIKTLQS